MPEYKKYPKRTDYNKNIGEGKNFIFETPNICVSVAWYGASFDGRYKITFAWRATDKVNFPEYPFIRTKRDKAKVTKFIQSNCEHGFDFWNYHAVCHKCQLWLIGDYRSQVIEKEGEEAVKMHDEYILENYGKVGLALRREAAGIKDDESPEYFTMNLTVPSDIPSGNDTPTKTTKEVKGLYSFEHEGLEEE